MMCDDCYFRVKDDFCSLRCGIEFEPENGEDFYGNRDFMEIEEIIANSGWGRDGY
jgi:hypothetical protein